MRYPRANTYLQGPTKMLIVLVLCNYDTRRVITASWSEPSDTQTGSTSQSTLTFNHSVPATQLTSADFTVSGGLSYTISPTSGNSATYTITVTHPANTSGNYTVTFAQNGIDAANTYLRGPSSNVTSDTIDYDTRVRVSVSSASIPSGTQEDATITGSITFDRSIPTTELTNSDFTLTGGATIALDSYTGSRTSFNFTITQPTSGNGSYTVSLKANSISAGTGYLGGPANVYMLGTVDYDRRSVVGVTSFGPKLTTPAAQSASTREFELDFDRDIDATALTSADFTISDNTVTFNSISPTSGTEDTYTVTVSQPADAHGSYTITLEMNAVPAKDNAYKAGPASDYRSTSASFDRRTAVSVTSFGLKSGTTTSSSSATREFELVLDRSITASELTQADFTISDMAVTWGSISGSGTTYTITVNQPNNDRGDYTITLRQYAISTTTTYLRGPIAAQATSSVSFDRRSAITVTGDTLPSTEQDGATVTGTITFSSAVPVISASDFTLSAGSIAITQTTGTHQTYNFTITQPTSGNGTYTVSLNANVISETDSYRAGPTSTYSLGTVTYDTRSSSIGI